MQKEITIQTKRELDIYMNPQRQRLLKCMDIHGAPMTPKQLSDLLEISASSVTYHLKKLQELGVVELDHSELIHGICAKFYRRIPVMVNLNGGKKDDLQLEKEVLLDYMINDTWNEFKRYMKKQEDAPDELKGDMTNGIVYLDQEDIKQLKTFIHEFQERHSTPKANCVPWEMTLIAYPQEVKE